VKYGVTRDYVLGCDVVLPGGKLLKLGGRSHKDVVGLDLTRLMVGSEGTLGVITALRLKLLPKPEASASLLAGYPSLDAALLSMGQVFAAGILPSAVEFMGETVLEILRATGETPWPDTVNSLLLFQVDGSAACVPLEIARLGARLDDALWRLQGAAPEEENAIWAHRRRISAASYVFGPDRIGGDMAVPRGSLLGAVRRFEAIAGANGKRLIAFGHAGDGNIHANLHYDAADPDDTARTMKAHHAMDEAVLEFGGSISGEHGGGCLKDVGRQLGEDERAMMRAVRAVFDPRGILNPLKGY
jgi:D-lactate dehydrogenase (cytochrome)/glycolate oxidase